MNKKQTRIEEPSSIESLEDVKKDDIAWGCIEDMLSNQSIPEYDVFPHAEEYQESMVYQQSKHYNPFASSKGSSV